MKHTVPPELLEDFKQKHHLSHESFERLLGFSSNGRASIRWKKEGAPPYVGIMVAYADKHGLALMEKLAAEREAQAEALDN